MQAEDSSKTDDGRQMTDDGNGRRWTIEDGKGGRQNKPDGGRQMTDDRVKQTTDDR